MSARKSQNPVLSFQFASGQSALKIPFELSNNLILVQAQLNDSQPLWFIFDTGANSSIVDAQLVKKLKLRTRGKAQGSASGGAIEAELIPGLLPFPVSRFSTKPSPLSQLNSSLRC